jgi:hypothetical protein
VFMVSQADGVWLYICERARRCATSDDGGVLPGSAFPFPRAHAPGSSRLAARGSQPSWRRWPTALVLHVWCTFVWFTSRDGPVWRIVLHSREWLLFLNCDRRRLVGLKGNSDGDIFSI